MVDTGENPHPRPVGEIHDLLAEACQQGAVDLEKIVARIGFQNICQRLAEWLSGA